MIANKKIVLFLGSFNPIHIGHTALASYTINNLNADELWFVPSPQNPMKNSFDTLPFVKRVNIINEAISDEPRFRVCDIEKNLSAPYYTIHTLGAIKAIYPNNEFTILVGADSIKSIDKWYRGDEIMQKYNIVVYPRLGYDIDSLTNIENITIMNDAPIIGVSSTDIRIAKKRGLSIKYFMPKPYLWELF